MAVTEKSPCVDGVNVKLDVLICRPDYVLARQIAYCPFCKARKRFLVQLYEWYDPIHVCGGCGREWSGVLLSRKGDCDRNRTYVRKCWKEALPWRQAVREVVKNLMGGESFCQV